MFTDLKARSHISVIDNFQLEGFQQHQQKISMRVLGWVRMWCGGDIMSMTTVAGRAARRDGPGTLTNTTHYYSVSVGSYNSEHICDSAPSNQIL